MMEVIGGDRAFASTVLVLDARLDQEKTNVMQGLKYTFKGIPSKH